MSRISIEEDQTIYDHQILKIKKEMQLFTLLVCLIILAASVLVVGTLTQCREGLLTAV